MEELYVATNHHREKRILRIKANVEIDKWLRRRYARDNETCRRMAASLHEPDHTQTKFFKTFCPDEFMKTMVQLGQNPYRNPRMRPHLHKKKNKKFKARDRSRKSKMMEREFDLSLEPEPETERNNNNYEAWELHLSNLKKIIEIMQKKSS